MRFEEVIWREQFLDKIIHKHQIEPGEVEEALQGKPLVRRKERGRQKGQDLYAVYGRTDAGRYVVVFLIRKAARVVMPISARDMTETERTFYEAGKSS